MEVLDRVPAVTFTMILSISNTMTDDYFGHG